MPDYLVYPNRDTSQLVARAQSLLGMTHEQYGTALGASKRTAARWAAGRSSLSAPALCKLAALVYPRDPSLAQEIAAAASETLVSLGIVAPPAPVRAPPPHPVHLLVDSVVCAAADAVGAAPASVRASLLAALKRARELRLGMEDVERALEAARATATPVSAE